MSKKCRNHATVHSGWTSSDEVYDTDEDVTILKEITPFNKETCHSVIVISDSEDECTKKRSCQECSDDSDCNSELNKYHKMKKSRPELYKRGNNRKTDNPKESFVIDRKSQPFVEEECHLCEVCNASFYTHDLYQNHVNGSSHEEAVKRMRSTAKGRYPEINGHSSESSRVSDRCPPVPYGVKRIKIKDEAFIQQDVERTCPGLEYVTEIRGLKETSYLCTVCDKPFEDKNGIISHLKDNKHKVKSLKALKPDWYKTLEIEPKKQRKRLLYDMLKKIEISEGMGKIVVERDYLDADYKASQNLDILGTSSESAVVAFGSNTNSSLVLPDPSKVDYFCMACECIMFDDELWKSHSKKRLRNLRKYPVGKAPKIKIMKKSKEDAFLIHRVTIPYGDPMVGLDYVREFQHNEMKKETYHCLLCGDCLSCMDITQHLASLSHRKKYIEHIDHWSLDIVNGLNPNEKRTFDKVEDICRRIQAEYGRGCPEVYVINKNSEET